jgi:hypothetical protein
MQSAFDPTRPSPLPGGPPAAAAVHSDIDWCLRCSRRLVALDPRLGAGQALDLARELSGDGELRMLAPELVAEDLYRIDLQVDD